MRRGRDSVRTVVGREKRGTSASMHASVPWAVPCPLLAPCLAQRDEWPTTCGWRLGNQEHPHLSTLSPGNIPTEVEAFPELFFCAAPLPKSRTADGVVPS